MEGGREKGRVGEDIKQGTAPKSSRKIRSSHSCVQGPSPHSKLLLGMTFSHPGQAGGGGASWLPNVNITECCMLPEVSQHPSLAVVNSLLLNSS